MKWLTLLLLFVATGCYTKQKATSQFGKAAAAYPELPADYCARTYPSSTDTVVKGVTTTVFDTIYTGGETLFDTVVVMDTKYITKTIQLPGTKVIERTVRVDTVEKVSTKLLAALDLCSIERGKAITLATDKTKEADKWKRIAKRRFWIIAGMGAAMALGLFVALRRKVVKKVSPV